MRKSVGLAALVALLLSACDSGGTATNPILHPTLVQVAPEDFASTLGCSAEGEAGGALQRYVATLVDVTRDDGVSGEEPAAGGAGSADSSGGGAAGTATGGVPGEAPADESDGLFLPSSPPTRCDTSIGFSHIGVDRRYQAYVDGYDRRDIRPLAEGLSVMLADGSDSVVAPRWRWRCGGDSGVLVIDETTVRVLGCVSLSGN